MVLTNVSNEITMKIYYIYLYMCVCVCVHMTVSNHIPDEHYC